MLVSITQRERESKILCVLLKYQRQWSTILILKKKKKKKNNETLPQDIRVSSSLETEIEKSRAYEVYEGERRKETKAGHSWKNRIASHVSKYFPVFAEGTIAAKKKVLWLHGCNLKPVEMKAFRGWAFYDTAEEPPPVINHGRLSLTRENTHTDTHVAYEGNPFPSFLSTTSNKSGISIFNRLESTGRTTRTINILHTRFAHSTRIKRFVKEDLS